MISPTGMKNRKRQNLRAAGEDEETLARPKEEIPKGLSSSSPFPEAGGTTDATSPLQRLAPISESAQRVQEPLQLYLRCSIRKSKER